MCLSKTYLFFAECGDVIVDKINQINLKLEELEQIEATVISDRKMLTKVISTCMDDMENIGSWFYLLVYSVEYFF